MCSGLVLEDVSRQMVESTMDILLQHALLNSFVLVSACPSNRNRAASGAFGEVYQTALSYREGEARRDDGPLTMGSHSLSAFCFVDLTRASSSLRERVSMPPRRREQKSE